MVSHYLAILVNKQNFLYPREGHYLSSQAVCHMNMCEKLVQDISCHKIYRYAMEDCLPNNIHPSFLYCLTSGKFSYECIIESAI